MTDLPDAEQIVAGAIVSSCIDHHSNDPHEWARRAVEALQEAGLLVTSWETRAVAYQLGNADDTPLDDGLLRSCEQVTECRGVTGWRREEGR